MILAHKAYFPVVIQIRIVDYHVGLFGHPFQIFTGFRYINPYRDQSLNILFQQPLHGLFPMTEIIDFQRLLIHHYPIGLIILRAGLKAPGHLVKEFNMDRG